MALAYETPVAVRAFDAPELRVLTVLHTSTRSTRLVARIDRGITRGSELRGKQVAVPRGTNAEFFLDTLLALSGLGQEEITRVDLPPAEVGPALERGDVDAASIWYPHARALPGTVELLSTGYTEVSMLLTRADVLRERRGALLAMVRALARAEQLAVERPAVALASVNAALEELQDDVVAEAWGRAHPQLGMGHVLLTLLEREAEWHRVRAGAGSAPRILPLLAPELLEEVVPEAVTLFSSE